MSPFLAKCALCFMVLFTPLVAQEKSPIPWEEGPCVGHLGTIGELKVPKGYLFAGAADAKKFLEITKNIPSGDELGVLVSPGVENVSETWFVIFTYHEVGYIRDDEKDKLDAPAILDSIKKGTEAGNIEKRKRGWPTLDIVGWSNPPFYDTKTNNLTWGVLAKDPNDNEEVINHSVRLLGRSGYLTAELVLSPKAAVDGIPAFGNVLSGYSYIQGKRYAEFTKGDKVAAIGLTALVAGGAGAVLANSGLLAKFWKLLVIGAVAVVAFFKRLFTGKSKKD